MAMSPVAVSHSLHAGKMVRGENCLVGYKYLEIRHMNTDVFDNFFCCLIPQFATLSFFCLAGKIETIGTGNMVTLRRQTTVCHGRNLEASRFLPWQTVVWRRRVTILPVPMVSIFPARQKKDSVANCGIRQQKKLSNTSVFICRISRYL